MLEAEDLPDAVLVGHSSSGSVITGVTARELVELLLAEL